MSPLRRRCLVVGLLALTLLGLGRQGLADGSSKGYVEMPESPDGDWVLTHGTGSGHNWGQPAFVRYLIMVAQEWRRRYPDGPRLRIGDMSKPDGSNFPPHKTHRDGLTADIFTTPRNVCHIKYGDQEQTLELARLMHDLGARQILYNGQLVADVVPVASKWPKHDDHFHVVIDPSRVPEEGALLVLPRGDRKDGAWVGAADLDDDRTELELGWQVIGQTRARHVRVLFDDLDDQNGLLHDSGPLRSQKPSYTVPLALEHGQSYRWRVELSISEEQTLGIEWQTLRVDLEPPTAEALAPADEAELRAPPLLRWRYQKAGVAQGDVVIELDQDRSHRKVWKRLGPFTGSVAEHGLQEPLKRDKRYYWRAVVRDARGNEAVTEWRSFHTTHDYDRDAAPGSGGSASDDSGGSEGPVGVVKASALNLRAGPGTGNRVLKTVSQGTSLRILREQGGWLEVVEPSGTQGWVSADFVER